MLPLIANRKDSFHEDQEREALAYLFIPNAF
jgi:hypothetical protein